MASRALTSVPRGFLFCAYYKPIEMLDPSDGEDPYFAELHPGRQEFLFGQIKNNLAAKVMVSHRYHMETVTVGYDAEAQKDIKASRLVIHGLIAQNVEDIVIEQEKSAGVSGPRAPRPRRGWWVSWRAKARCPAIGSSTPERRPGTPKTPSTGRGETSGTGLS